MAAGEFVEHAVYAGNRYGTLRTELERPARGIVLEIDLQGARQVRETLPEADADLHRAAVVRGTSRSGSPGRGSDSAEQIERRLAAAPEELAARDEFDHRDRERRPGPGRARSSRARRYHVSAVIKPRLDKLLERVDSHYAVRARAAKRARQINSYYHNLGEGTFDEYPPPMVETGLEELPQDLPRGDRRRQDQVPLPLGGVLGPDPARRERGDRRLQGS